MSYDDDDDDDDDYERAQTGERAAPKWLKKDLEIALEYWAESAIFADPDAPAWDPYDAAHVFIAFIAADPDWSKNETLAPGNVHASIERMARTRLGLGPDEPIRARVEGLLGLQRYEPDPIGSVQVPMLIDGLFPTTGVHMITGLPENGKSWIAYEAAAAVARGRPFAGGGLAPKRGRAALIDFEVGSKEVARRLRVLGVRAEDALYTRSFPDLRPASKAFWSGLEALRPALIVIDSLSGGAGTDFPETDARYAEPLRLAQQYVERRQGVFPIVERDCSVVFLHHSAKSASAKDPESLFRGSGAIRSTVDFGLYAKKVSTDGPPRFRLSRAKLRTGEKFAPLDLELVDGIGLRRAATRQKATPSGVKVGDLEAQVLELVAAEPGISTTAIAARVGRRATDVRVARDALVASGRLHARGSGRAAGLFCGAASTP